MIKTAAIATGKSDEMAFVMRTLAAIRAVCNLPADIPHDEIADAIRECMTERPNFTPEQLDFLIRSGK